MSMGNDREFWKLIKCVEEKSIDHKDADMRKYTSIFNELAVVNGLAFRGERIVVPQTLREATVKIAHEGHKVLFVQSSYSVSMRCFLVWTQWSKSM